MSPSRAFARQELDQVVHTWRLYVLPGLLLFFGLTAPVLAALLPELAEYATGETPGAVIELPPPTATDAYAQFLGNLQQLGSLVAVIIGAGVIASEVRTGTAALILAKPLSRTQYVLTKATAHFLLTVAAALAGAVACAAVTAVVFEVGPLGRFLAAIGCWTVLAAFLIAIATLLSAALRSQMAAAAAAAAIAITVGALSQVPAVGDYAPVGLWSAAGAILTGEPARLAVPIVTAVAGTAAALTAAVLVFRRREI